MNGPADPPRSPGAAGPDGHGLHGECYACPIGGLFLTLQGARPDATEHLLNAVHELIGVARAFLDAADEVVEQRRQAVARRDGEPRVTRIDIE